MDPIIFKSFLKESTLVLDAISQFFDKNERLDDELATKRNFIQLIKDAPLMAFLHLSTHAEASQDSAYIVFRGLGDTSLLKLEELYKLRIEAMLAVLSACETGNGKIQEGEGVMSLARAFFHTGCRSVIASQWKVKHAPNAFIMKQLYQYLGEGYPIDEALRLAKMDFRDRKQHGRWQDHPGHWAAMIAIGNMQVIAPQRAIGSYLGGIGLLLFLLGLGWYVWKKK